MRPGIHQVLVLRFCKIALIGWVLVCWLPGVGWSEPTTNQQTRASVSKPLASALSPGKWKSLEASVDRGLAYLASRQEPDGSFPTIPSGQPGVTSLCIMAFLSRGHQPGGGDYGERLNRAIDFVISCQRADGLLSQQAPGLSWQRYEASHTA